MQRRQNKTLAALSAKAFNREIGFAGYDSVEKTIDGHHVSYDKHKTFASNYNNADDRIGENAEHKARRKYRDSVGRQILSFFFNNFMAMRRDTQNLGLTLLFNVIFKPEADAPTWLKALQYTAMGLGFATGILPLWFAYSVAKNTVLNTAKVVGKLIPALAIDGVSELQKRIDDKLKNEQVSAFAAFLLEAAHVALSVLKAPFQVIHFAGSAALSPIDHARLMYKETGIVGAVGSVVATGVLWAIFFPITAAAAAKYVPSFLSNTVAPWFNANVLPFLTAYVPGAVKAGQVVGSALSTAYQAVSGWLSQSLSWLWTSTIGNEPGLINILTDMLIAKFNVLTNGLVGLDVSGKLIAFGAVLGTVGATIGSPLVRAYQAIRNAFNNSTVAPVVVPAAVPAAQPAPGTKAALAATVVSQGRLITQLQADLPAKPDKVDVQAGLDSRASVEDVRVLAERVEKQGDTLRALGDAHEESVEALGDAQDTLSTRVTELGAAQIEFAGKVNQTLSVVREEFAGQAAAIAKLGLNSAPAADPKKDIEQDLTSATAPSLSSGNE